MGSLFFWRDRTREVDFVVDIGGRLELFEAKWTELPAASDAVNLDFVRNVVGKSRIACPSVLFRLLRCHCILDGVENSQRGLCRFATNSLGYLLDWEKRSLHVSFRTEISCTTLLRWGCYAC